MPLFRFDRDCFQQKVKYNCLEEGSRVPPCVGCEQFMLDHKNNKVTCKLINTKKCKAFVYWKKNLPKWAGIDKFKKALKRSLSI